MFWKVTGFSQPSPIEQILDQEEFTLEQLLDEDDIIQECKSLNGRLVAFLRERSTVEQLVRYLVDPPLDADDPKRAYKYPFTACEVFCCEVEAVFNTLLEDNDLMALLFSLLDAPAPLNSKTAGYFGRVVGHLLLRKTHELMQYLQEHAALLHALVKHVDTVSIAEILKRLVGADEQSSVLFLAQYAAWLAETPLVDLLLDNLGPSATPDAQSNAADILCAIAHTQPSPLASKLTQPASMALLFSHALAPGHTVLVPALDVCVALVEPRRSAAMEELPMQDAALHAKAEAVEVIVQYVPQLVEVMQQPSVDTVGAPPGTTAEAVAGNGAGASDGSTVPAQETPYGLLAPPLGRARLKAVELVAVLLRSGSAVVEPAVVATNAMRTALGLFAAYPFNNLLHHWVVALLVAALTKSSPVMLQHLFEHCRLLEWLITLPTEIRPAPVPGQETVAASKPLLRAGYMGHVTQIASTLESFSTVGTGMPVQLQEQGTDSGGTAPAGGDMTDTASSSPSHAIASEITPVPTGQPSSAAGPAVGPHSVSAPDSAGLGPGAHTSVSAYLESDAAWQTYLQDVLQPRQELENVSRWACGRPTNTEPTGLDSDGDEFQAEMELEQMVGMQPVLYHRYHDEDLEEEEEGEDAEPGGDDADDGPVGRAVGGSGAGLLGALGGGAAGGGYDVQAAAEGIRRIDLGDNPWQQQTLTGVSYGQFAGGEVSLTPQGATSGPMSVPLTGQLSSERSTHMEETDDVLLASSDDEPADEEGQPLGGLAGSSEPVARADDPSSPTAQPVLEPLLASAQPSPAAQGTPVEQQVQS